MSNTARRARHVAQLDGYETGADAHLRATEAALAAAADATVVVLVEGISDQIAVDAMLARSERRLDHDVVAVPIGGAQAVDNALARFTERDDLTVLGLCDHAEANFFADAFAAHGFDGNYFVCNPDLEAELIAAFEPHELEVIIAAQGELKSLRIMQKQAAWRERPFDEQVHRWIRARALRSSRYASVLIEAASKERLPPPLRELIARI